MLARLQPTRQTLIKELPLLLLLLTFSSWRHTQMGTRSAKQIAIIATWHLYIWIERIPGGTREIGILGGCGRKNSEVSDWDE